MPRGSLTLWRITVTMVALAYPLIGAPSEEGALRDPQCYSVRYRVEATVVPGGYQQHVRDMALPQEVLHPSKTELLISEGHLVFREGTWKRKTEKEVWNLDLGRKETGVVELASFSRGIGRVRQGHGRDSGGSISHRNHPLHDDLEAGIIDLLLRPQSFKTSLQPEPRTELFTGQDLVPFLVSAPDEPALGRNETIIGREYDARDRVMQILFMRNGAILLKSQVGYGAEMLSLPSRLVSQVLDPATGSTLITYDCHIGDVSLDCDSVECYEDVSFPPGAEVSDFTRPLPDGSPYVYFMDEPEHATTWISQVITDLHRMDYASASPPLSPDMESRVGTRETRMCGPITLALACRILGVHVDAYSLSAKLEWSADSSSVALSELARAAARLDLGTGAFEISRSADLAVLPADHLVIGLVRGNHFALLRSLGDGRVLIAEYPKRPAIADFSLLDQILERRILVLYSIP